MSENEIKPVAWMVDEQGMTGQLCTKLYWARNGGTPPSFGQNHSPLYDQSAIDRLTAELRHYQMAATAEANLADERHKEIKRLRAERDAAVADAERYRKIEALAAGTPEQWQAVEDAAFASHWGNVQNFALNIDAIDAARAEGGV